MTNTQSPTYIDGEETHCEIGWCHEPVIARIIEHESHSDYCIDHLLTVAFPRNKISYNLGAQLTLDVA